jgi:hypothetical protein
LALFGASSTRAGADMMLMLMLDRAYTGAMMIMVLGASYPFTPEAVSLVAAVLWNYWM